MSLDQSHLPALVPPATGQTILQQTNLVLGLSLSGREQGGRMEIRQSFIMNAVRTSFVIVFLIKQLFQNIFTGVWAGEDLPTR